MNKKYHQTIGQLAHLHKLKEEQPPAPEGELPQPLALLKQWQSERLARTHADLLASPRYGPACDFFLSDIYAPRDFSQRDHDIEYLYTVMSRFLPDFLIRVVRKTIELNRLTNALDHALARALVEDLGVTDTITPALYAEGYRICNNYAERAEQIERLVEVGRLVETGTHNPLVNATLRLARRPAYAAGWGEVHDFLERGFDAFRHMGKTDEFLNTLFRREMGILMRIFDGDENPFETR